MPRYDVELSPRALDDLDRIAPETALRIARKLKDLETDPAPRGDRIKRLHGFAQPRFRLRVGDYRAIFMSGGFRVVVLRVVHRSELERALSELL